MNIDMRLIAIVTILIVLFSWGAREFFPKTIIEHSQPVVIVDSVHSMEGIKKRDAIIAEKDNFIQKLLHEHKEGIPVISIGRPPQSPLAPTVIKETVYVSGNPIENIQKYYGYDFPISLVADDDRISITTVNPLIEKNGGRYTKVYDYPRDETNFRLALRESRNEQSLDGIRLIFDRKPIAFKGIFIGSSSTYPIDGYVFVKTGFEFYSRLSTEIELRTIDKPLWFTMMWKM